MSFDRSIVTNGDRSQLNGQDLATLENQVIPTALKWLDKPGLRGHAIQTLTYWGESIPARYFTAAE